MAGPHRWCRLQRSRSPQGTGGLQGAREARTGCHWEGAPTPASTTATSDQDGGFPRRLRPAQVGVTSNSRRYARKIRSNWSGSWRNRSRTHQLRGWLLSLDDEPQERHPRLPSEHGQDVGSPLSLPRPVRLDHKAVLLSVLHTLHPRLLPRRQISHVLSSQHPSTLTSDAAL